MSRVKIAVLSFFILICFIFVSNAPSSEPGGDNVLDYAVKQFYYDGKNLLLSPLHWDKKEKIEFLLVASVTAGLYLADEGLKDAAQRNRSDFSDDLAKLVTPSEQVYPTITISGFYLGGLIFNLKKEKDTALYLLESL
ncbi:MAG TPA: hypothetical protein VMT04_10745, partial [Terriglobales bacterium]|nr:hypothetical protein [Terriglobales bacterium]